jgi:hypothetical protein
LCLLSHTNILDSCYIKWLKKGKAKYVSLNSLLTESHLYWEILAGDNGFGWIWF